MTFRLHQRSLFVKISLGFLLSLRQAKNHGTFADGLECCYDGAMTEKKHDNNSPMEGW